MKFGFGASGASDSYKQILERVLYAEELGFESASLSEHHGLSHVISSPLIGLAGLATRTSRIKLATIRSSARRGRYGDAGHHVRRPVHPRRSDRISS